MTAAPILVALANPATAQRLMHLAHAIGVAEGRPLHAMHVLTVPRPFPLTTVHGTPELAHATTLLEHAQATATELGGASSAVVEVGRDVPSALAAAVESRGADAVVLGWSDEGGSDSERAFDGLMHRVAAAIGVRMIVAKFRGATPERVLVGLTHSPHLSSVVAVADALEADGAAVDRVHCVAAGTEPDEARAALAGSPGGSEALGTEAVEIVAVDPPERLLLDRASRYDALVIGAVAKAGLARAVFGSRTETVAADAPCSVVVCRAARP